MDVDRNDNARVVDPDAIDQLRELRVDGEPDPLAELVDMYIADTAQRIETISAAIGDERHADIERGAHALAGGSAVFGAESLIAVCRRLQMAGRAADLGAARELIDRLEQEFERIRAALHAELRNDEA